MASAMVYARGLNFGNGCSRRSARNKQNVQGRPLISVVIPAFNEVQTLPTILCKLQGAGRP
jgi:hypothetical protein